MAKNTTNKDEPEKTSGAPKLFDVAQPGKTAASATSRPVIVGHGSMIKQDPMVKGSEDQSKEKASPTKGIKIEPISETNETSEKTEDSNLPESQPAASEPANEEKDKNPEKEESSSPEDNQNSTESESAGSEVATELANKIATNKENKAKAEAQAKKAEELNKLIESKKYFVDIHQGPTSRNISSWILGILLLAVVGVIFAIDAGLLNVGLLLPFDLIKN